MSDPFATLDGIRAAEREDNAAGPRFRDCPVNVLRDEPLRLRRLSLSLAAAMASRLQKATTPEARAAELLHLCQISLSPAKSSGLRFPGDEGKAVLAAALGPERVRLLGEALEQWNGLNADPTATADETAGAE